MEELFLEKAKWHYCVMVKRHTLSHTHTHSLSHTHTHSLTYTHTSSHTHTLTLTCLHTYTHSHILTDTHTRSHTHTHTLPPGTEVVLAAEVTGRLGSPSPPHGSRSRAFPSLGPAVLRTQTVQQLLCWFFGLGSRLFISLPVIRCSTFGDISK